MSTPTAIYFLAIVLVGVPSALRWTFEWRWPWVNVQGVRNHTAFAMVAMWLFGRLVWELTGEWLPVKAMVVQDMFVIAAMFLKDDWRTCPYRNMPHQLACLWLERTPWDKRILALFPLAWLFYAPVVEPQLQFWVLWGIGLAQLALAGHEALHLWQRANGHELRAHNESPHGLEFAVAGRWHE